MQLKRLAVGLMAGLALTITLLVGALWPAAAAGDAPPPPSPSESITRTITLAPARDNTLYQNEVGNVSNGQGQHLFAGNTQNDELRRALVAFDLTGVPPWATVLSATLTLTMSKTIAGETPVALHTVSQSWGEGASDAVGEEGAGAAAEPGDATWMFRFFSTDSWTTPGGDFDPTPVATTPVGDTGAYSWSSAELLAGVQAWVTDPASNHGWALLGDETTTASAKRFDSGQNTPENRPSLEITYEADVYALFAPVVLRE